ncbi:MAG: hybrid sensor histidine kinase/response regulator [Chloroflexota bacterium]
MNQHNSSDNPPLNTDTVRTDTVRTDTVRTDTVRTDTVRTDTVRTDTARAKANDRADILIIDDQADNLNLLISMLNSAGYKTRPAMSGEMGLRAAKAAPPDLVLLDINMPDLDGYEICKRLKEDETLQDVPVIFISARNDTIDKLKAFQHGGVDYITKPYHLEEVQARIQTHVTIRHQQLSLQAKYEQEQRYLQVLNDTKDEFMRMASHDLKNPINAINLLAKLMAKRCSPDDPKVAQYLQGILDTTGRMTQMITELLDLARIESGMALKKESTELLAFIEPQIEQFRLQVNEKQQTLQYTRPDTPCFVEIDRSAIQQVMSNLISNAMKYTPTDGSIQVSVTQTPRHVTIAVQDNGPGIAPAHIPHIFDRFYRVNNDDLAEKMRVLSNGHGAAIHTELNTIAHPKNSIEEGSGLGLSIVKTLVEQHHGRVWVESSEQEGSRFFVELPK